MECQSEPPKIGSSLWGVMINMIIINASFCLMSCQIYEFKFVLELADWYKDILLNTFLFYL